MVLYVAEKDEVWETNECREKIRKKRMVPGRKEKRKDRWRMKWETKYEGKEQRRRYRNG